MTSWTGKYLGQAVLALLLAACGTQTIEHPAPEPGPAGVADRDCGPCCGKDPAAEARSIQGVSPARPDNPYTGKDTYANVAIDEGTVLYSLTPGSPPGFAVTEDTLRDARGEWASYYALVQVTTDPGKDEDGRPRTLRDKVRAFHVVERLCAARGTARANPQFGSGGGIQYYVSPSDESKLRPGGILPISRWAPPSP